MFYNDYGVIDWKAVCKHLGAEYQGEINGMIMVSLPFKTRRAAGFANSIVFLSDNGGEINIDGFNYKTNMPSISCTHPRAGGKYCGPMTIAYRLHAKFTGVEVNYDQDVDQAFEDIAA